MAKDLAVALSGLGGFNNFGAGALMALKEQGVTPDAITATSGQIVVLAEWLMGTDLSTLFPDTPNGLVSGMTIATTGVPGVFKPAFLDFFSRLWWPFNNKTLDKVLPAQQFKPSRPPHLLQEYVAVMQDCPIPIIYNGYHIESGRGILYGNNAAHHDFFTTASLEPMTTESLESALWLSQYGFDKAPNGVMDGAYHRSTILKELFGYKEILVVRPIPNGWRGELPTNVYDVEDWKTKMWFSNTYKLEREFIDELNWQDKSRAYENKTEHQPSIITEVCYDEPSGFFDYFGEKNKVYQRGLDLTHQALTGITAQLAAYNGIVTY